MNNEKITELQKKREMVQWSIVTYGNLPELEKQLKQVEIELDVAWRNYSRR